VIAISSNAKSYDDAVIAITNTFVDLPTTMTGLDNMLYSQTGYLQSENIRSIGQKALEYQEKAGISYDKAKALYESIEN
jgi:hypothetical protein